MKDVTRFLHWLEDSLLVLLLSTLIVLATTQIFLRNFFDMGLVWVDPLLRVMVLWLGLIGAAIAAREHKHIQIDLLTRLLSKNSLVPVQAAVDQFSAWVCLIIAWYGASWVQLDYADQINSFIGVPAWTLEIIIPISFGIIGARYFSHSVQGLWRYFYPDKAMVMPK
jgi:TRAP-type C4-dicarboxylate transport system permease small subunit